MLEKKTRKNVKTLPNPRCSGVFALHTSFWDSWFLFVEASLIFKSLPKFYENPNYEKILCFWVNWNRMSARRLVSRQNEENCFAHFGHNSVWDWIPNTPLRPKNRRLVGVTWRRGVPTAILLRPNCPQFGCYLFILLPFPICRIFNFT